MAEVRFLGCDNEQQTIIITGASDGIGAAAACQLSARGERVVLVGRSQQKTAAVANELRAPYHLADYADLDQVRNLASELRATYPRIDVLANNAGGIMGHREVTKDGFEKTFQVNHLAPFLLTQAIGDPQQERARQQPRQRPGQHRDGVSGQGQQREGQAGRQRAPRPEGRDELAGRPAAGTLRRRPHSR